MRTAIVILSIAAFVGTGYAATITPATCSLANVQAAIDSSSTGDTIKIPAGSCTWTSAVTIPHSKKLILTGAGSKLTVITRDPYGTAIYMGRSGSRITNIGLHNGIILAEGNNFRIDHCTLTLDTWNDGISVYSRDLDPPIVMTGVIDHNELNNMRVLASGTNYMLEEGNPQNILWTTSLDLGSEKAVYIENNIMVGSGGLNAIDGNYGGAFVFRYNTVNGLYIEAHSVQGNNRAIRKWEVYGNILNNTGSSIYYPFRIRGGTGVVFLNSVIGSWTNDGIALDNVRSYSDVGNGGLCNGSSSWDGNTDATGYPCRDQIGSGSDTTLWVYDPPGTYTQVRVPVYGWLNKTESSVEVPFDVINSCSDHIKENRDFYNYTDSFNGTVGMGCGTLASRPATCTAGVGYWATNQSCSTFTGMTGNNPSAPISGTLYRCTSTDTWTSHFTPYTYPHPLTVGTIYSYNKKKLLMGVGK